MDHAHAPARPDRPARPDGGEEIPTPAGFRWPGGKRVAVLSGIAFEAWSDGQWPGLSPMGNPLRPGATDWNAFHWAEYGPRRGMPRILEILARRGVTAGVMVNGVLAERYPDVVRAVAAAGHEIVSHSYAMDVVPVYLDEARERDNIARTTELIERATGVRPVGWISPRGTPSSRTARLLAEAGYDWIAFDYLDDDLPYFLRFGARVIAVCPGSMEVNDLPLHARHGQPPRAMLAVFEDTLASLRARDEAGKIDAIIHAHVFGRPAGIWVYDRILEIAQTAPDLWLGTWGQAVAHARRLAGFRS